MLLYYRSFEQGDIPVVWPVVSRSEELVTAFWFSMGSGTFRELLHLVLRKPQ
jgi:hypothetical protein